MSWHATILTLYPEMFPGPLGISLAGGALERGLWTLETKSIRDHGIGRHRAVDDTPAGGGPGMVLRCDVLAAALDAAAPAGDARPKLLLSPRGTPLRQARVRALAAGPGAVIVCGRFEGVDERVVAGRGLEEVSIGDYVLSGGEIAAMALSTPASVCCPASWARMPPGRRRVSRRGCSNTRITRARAIGRAAPSPRCC